MSAIDIAVPRLKTEEGFRARAYKDTNGFTTIGYGFNIDAGITPYAAAGLLQAQIHEIHEALLKYPWYSTLDEPRQSVCLDIAVNEGLHGLLAFPRMLAALQAQEWSVAATECHVTDPRLDARYAALAKILLTGITS